MLEFSEASLSNVTLVLEKTSECCLRAVTEGFSAEDDNYYKAARRWLRNHPAIYDRCPETIKGGASLTGVRRASQAFSPQWAPRRELIEREFEDAIDSIYILLQAPLADVDKWLVDLDSNVARGFWDKTKLRINRGDYDGAITASKSFLEAVIKRLLESENDPATGNEDLPQLWRKIGNHLNMLPAEHEYPAYKQILGNLQAVVGGISNIRNTQGDAHSPAANDPKPARRHAELVANLSAAAAQYLIEAWSAKQPPISSSE